MCNTVASVIGTALGLTMREALDHVGVDPGDDWLGVDRPAALCILQRYAVDGRRVVEWVPSDPFLGPLYRGRCCSTCGLLPGAGNKLFQVCSLCKDPKAGQFCCKDPCFAAFWKAGHKKECAGRDKLKKKDKGGDGAGPSGGG
jgi:hypothetical protein